jgi:TPR repeat protein
LRAANNGNTKAMNGIGFMYKHGRGVTKNIHTAIEWYTKLANLGHKHGQYILASIYETEDEVKDLQLAVNWYQKTADNNWFAKTGVQQLNKQGYYAEDDEQDGILISCIYFMMIIIKNITPLIRG